MGQWNVFSFAFCTFFKIFHVRLGKKSKSVSFSRVYVCVKAKLTLVSFFLLFFHLPLRDILTTQMTEKYCEGMKVVKWCWNKLARLKSLNNQFQDQYQCWTDVRNFAPCGKRKTSIEYIQNASQILLSYSLTYGKRRGGEGITMITLRLVAFETLITILTI